MGVDCKPIVGAWISLALKANLKFWRPVAVVVATAIAGCAPMRTGAKLDAIPPLKPGLSRIFVLRDRAYGGIFDTGWQAYLDEAPMGDLKTGTFVYLDRPPGSHRLYFARPGDLFRASQQEISVLPGAHLLFSPRHEREGQMDQQQRRGCRTHGHAGLVRNIGGHRRARLVRLHSVG